MSINIDDIKENIKNESLKEEDYNSIFRIAKQSKDYLEQGMNRDMVKSYFCFSIYDMLFNIDKSKMNQIEMLAQNLYSVMICKNITNQIYEFLNDDIGFKDGETKFEFYYLKELNKRFNVFTNYEKLKESYNKVKKEMLELCINNRPEKIRIHSLEGKPYTIDLKHEFIFFTVFGFIYNNKIIKENVDYWLMYLMAYDISKSIIKTLNL